MRLPPLVLALVTALGCRTADAQAFTPALTIGVVRPTGHLADHREAGPSVAASVWIGAPSRAWRAQLVGEAWRLPARAAGDPALSVGQLLACVAVATTEGAVRPAFVLGVGSGRLHIPGRPNPYGLVPAGVVGVGAGVPIGGGRLLRLEGRRHLIATDYGLGDFNWHTATVLSASVAF